MTSMIWHKMASFFSTYTSKFANSGHPTLVVSTDLAHSLSDSFAQDLTGGLLVHVEGSDSPLFALESLIANEGFQHILRTPNSKVDGKQKIMFALTSIKGTTF